MIQIAICDDNPITSKQIEQKLKEFCYIEYSAVSFPDSTSILSAIQNNSCRPDIILMDIVLPDASGIQTAKKINLTLPDCQIIYITNFIDYISDVYETSHLYYVLKSQMDMHLPKAISRAIQALDNLHKKVLLIHSHSQTFNLLQKDILYFERILRSTEIHTESAVYSTKEDLSQLEEQLCAWFVITHRSYLVNLKYAINMNRSSVMLKGNLTIPIGRTHYEEVKKRFARLMFPDERV